MAGQFPAAPTYAEVVLVDEQTKRFQFNPIWLRFFLDLVAYVNGNTGAGGGADHNTLASLQGGASNQYYHLTAAEESTLTSGPGGDATNLHGHRNQTAVSGITLTGSPFTYQNTSDYDADVIVRGGTVSALEFTRDNATFYNVGVVAGMFHLGPDDRLRVTYTVAPTMSYIQG